jgi:hypothetical protein
VSVLGIDTLKFVMAERVNGPRLPGPSSFRLSFNLDGAKARKKGELPPVANLSVDLKV